MTSLRWSLRSSSSSRGTEEGVMPKEWKDYIKESLKLTLSWMVEKERREKRKRRKGGE